MNQINWSPGVTLEAVERQVILKAYDFFAGNKTQTAIALGISVRTVDEKLKKYKADDESIKGVELERKAANAEQLQRARGHLPPREQRAADHEQPQGEAVPKAVQGNGSQPAKDAAAQQPVPMPQRAQVQTVLPKQAASGGAGGRR